MARILPPSMAGPIGEKLKQSRLAMKLSTREVAKQISDRFGITHATLSNYEAGRTTPPIDVLEILASFYNRPLTWYFETGPILTNIHYRNLKSRTKVADLRSFEAKAQQWIEAYWRLEKLLDVNLYNRHKEFTPKPQETGQSLANRLRKHLRLSESQPIRSVTELIDQFGVRAMEMPTDLPIDGLAARFGMEYVIILNSSVPNERCRMNAAHELGHILLGDCDKDYGHCDSNSEARAYEFASHLLIPQSELRLAFEGSSMVRLMSAKEYFGISLQAMIYRAEQSQIISKSTAKWLWIEFAKRGWRKNEPGFVRPDRATRFEHLLVSADAERRLKWEDAAKVLQIPEDELDLRLRFALGRSDDITHKGGDDANDGPAILSIFDR